MATKVKGEAIKEGSIPLKALSSGLAISSSLVPNDLIGEITESNPSFNLYEGFGENVVFITTNIQPVPKELFKNQKMKLDGPGNTYILWNENDNISIEGNLSMFAPIKIYYGVNMSNPDWNAVEGKPGYIKNKLFRFIDVNGNEYTFTNPLKKEDFIPEVDEYGDVYKYKKSIDTDYLQYVVCNKKITDYGNLYDAAYYPIEEIGNRFCVNLSEYGGYVYITEEYDEEAGYNKYWLIVEVFNANTFFPENSVYVIDSYENLVMLETLPESYLPNTILKTTPQSLSSTAKKQVKENLGITDVVTPDWNAQRGKAGYIENKPFYDIIDKKLNVSDFTYDENEGTYVCDLVSLNDGYLSDSYIFKVYIDDNYGNEIIESSVFNVGYEYSNEINFDILSNAASISLSVNVKYNSDDNSCIIKISAFDEYELETVLEMLRYTLGYTDTIAVKQLHNIYIPDTVIKTIPQTLSDADKKQVLANLGIKTPFQIYLENGGTLFTNENAYNECMANHRNTASIELTCALDDLSDTKSWTYVGLTMNNFYNIINGFVIEISFDDTTINIKGNNQDASYSAWGCYTCDVNNGQGEININPNDKTISYTSY